MYTEKSLNNSR